MTPRDLRFLTFEEQHWAHTGRKQALIRTEFGISTARYYSHIVRLTGDPEALKVMPQLVHRLIARQDAHQNARVRFLGGLA
jgi:hypothetical protein